MAWHDDLLARSEGLTTAVVLPGALAEPPFDEGDLVGLLAAAAPAIAAVQGGDYTLEVSVGRVGRMAYLDRIVHDPPAADERLGAWWERSFDAPASMTLAAIERFIDGRLASMLAPLFEAMGGTPSGGLETALTICTDGGDARGARRLDGPGLLVPLVGSAELSYWGEAEFEAVAGDRPVSFEHSALAPSASRAPLARGDLVFLPRGAAHRAVSEGLHAALVVRWRDATRFDFLRDALMSELARSLDDLVAPVGFDPLEPGSRWLEQQLLGDGVEALDVEVSQWRSDALESRRNELLSNAGFEREPLVRDGSALVLDGVEVQRTAPFPILVHERDGRLVVFARGRSFTCKATTSTRALFEHLGGGEAMTVDALREACGISARGLERLLRVLWSYRAIEVALPGGAG